LTGKAAALVAVAPTFCSRAENNPTFQGRYGAIVDEQHGAEVGRRVLQEGGNAIDAMVAAALASCVALPTSCGIGGYGGHMTIALAEADRVTSIDYNSMAAAAARPDMYPLDSNDEVVGRTNLHGWLAVGVPGTLAGLQLALDRFGTRSFAELVEPAIKLARDGVVITAMMARSIRTASVRFQKDAGSARVYLDNGEPRKQGELLRNPELAAMLTTLAERNSVDSFYRGDIAQHLADEFKRNGGLVTGDDLGAYHAREVEPLRLELNGHTICTAPLTAGGLTILEAMSVLKELRWPHGSGPEATHARLEAIRFAWRDRFKLLGDPEHVGVPVQRLLSKAYARDLGEKIEKAVKERKPAFIQAHKHRDEGTNNISCVDRHGNMVAATFTQGNTFGAQVTADGLGVTLGHGMSRFDPHPGHPNAPSAHKRPLHNMCPTVVLRKGRAVMAVGGAGGLRIPNTLYDVLVSYVLKGRSLADSVTDPRIHCTGTLQVGVQGNWPKADEEHLRGIGFEVRPDRTAYASAVSFNPRSGECQAAAR
jgi:gamma-glutamyltranspeptidase/glutathione hydrolase